MIAFSGASDKDFQAAARMSGVSLLASSAAVLEQLPQLLDQGASKLNNFICYRYPPLNWDRGLHVMHLFYSIDRVRWSQLPQGFQLKLAAR